MGPREKDSVRNAEQNTFELIELVKKLQKQIDLVKKDTKAIKKNFVRKYRTNNGK